MDRAHIEVVRLLLESAPAIFETTPHFAMKGGTAINLFIEDMPRLSVDIDVVYTDHQATRDNALKSISSALETARKRLAIADVKAEISSTKAGDEIKLFIRRGRNQVKVEVNHVFRGTIRIRPSWLGKARLSGSDATRAGRGQTNARTVFTGCCDG
jgi:hypothetical protein